MKRLLTIGALLGLLALGSTGCFEDLAVPERDNPLDPWNPDTDSPIPARPTTLWAVVSDRLVILSWSVGDASGIDHYKVYRWEVEDGAAEDYQLVGTAGTAEYEDSAVRNGQEYSYRVSGVNGLGLEGRRSPPLSVTPRLFSVAIEQGRPKVATRDVVLTLSASADAEMMQIANTPDLAGAAWEPYRATTAWRLTAGDGMKTVYVRFRDAEDAESAVASDDIELDTRAAIESVAEDTGGEVQFAGDVIHVRVATGEPFGTATFDVGGGLIGLELFDDGTGGDSVPDDGVYERDYTVEAGVEVVDAAVTGYFEDEVGNTAEPTPAPGTVTIHDPPSAVTLREPVALGERKLGLSWSRSTEPDFGGYKLYRSYVPGVAASTARELIAEPGTPGDTEFTDTGLRPDSTYYYAVYVVDQIGLEALSNEVAGTTLANEPPDPVVLYSPWAPDTTSLEISWSASDAEDFRAYELIGWDQDPPDPPNSAGKRLLARFTMIDDTFYTHTSLIDSFVYWYQVVVVDSFGARAVSDSVSGSPRPAGR